MLDVVSNRKPRVQCALEGMDQFELVLFVGPVWMGQVASPFRSCFAQLRARVRNYGFVSICGGADGPNPGLAAELERRMGADPVALVELHIADLLPPDPRPERSDTMGYRLNDGDLSSLTETVVNVFTKHLNTRRAK